MADDREEDDGAAPPEDPIVWHRGEEGFEFDRMGRLDPTDSMAEPVVPSGDPEPPSAVAAAVAEDTVERIEGADDNVAAVGTPAEATVEDDFFDFGYLEDAREVERYWLNEPYAFASVLYDPDSRTNYYHVSEPALDETEAYVRADLAPAVKDALADADLEAGTWEDFDRAVVAAVDEYESVFPPGTRHKVAYYLMRDFRGYGRLDPLLRDRAIEDISGDGADVPVFVYHDRYRDLPTNVVLDGREMDGMVRRLAQRAGEPISFSDPIVSASLPDNHRVQLTLGTDVGPRGSNFTIRLFKAIPFTPVDLIRRNTFSAAAMAFLWLCIEHRKSIVFAGPTASGKTTSMNAVSLFIEPYTKVVTIERTRELSIPHDNWVAGVARQGRNPDSDVTMSDLLNAALHQRPEYLLVGEIRTEPDVLRTFLQSVFTGHAGSTTFHAHDVEDVVNRFRSEPFDLSDQMIASVDLVAVQRQVAVGERGDRRRERRCIRLSEIDTDRDGTLQTRTLFEYDPDADEHAATGTPGGTTLAEIGRENGWAEEKLRAELARRRTFLEYLAAADIDDYRDVWAAIFAYRRDRESVLAAVEDGTFDPSALTINYYD